MPSHRHEVLSVEVVVRFDGDEHLAWLVEMWREIMREFADQGQARVSIAALEARLEITGRIAGRDQCSPTKPAVSGVRRDPRLAAGAAQGSRVNSITVHTGRNPRRA